MGGVTVFGQLLDPSLLRAPKVKLPKAGCYCALREVCCPIAHLSW